MTAALGSQRNELPSFPPPGAQVLARLLFIIFTWELSLWRGLVSAETRGVEPNGLRPGPALSRHQGWGLSGWMSSQPLPPASCREKEASSAPCRGLGRRNRRTFLVLVSLLGGCGSAWPWLPWGGGPELSEGGGSGPASDALPVDVPAEQTAPPGPGAPTSPPPGRAGGAKESILLRNVNENGEQPYQQIRFPQPCKGGGG